MLWDWLIKLSCFERNDARSCLPVLQKQAVVGQQQQLSVPSSKEYCTRMAFKLTPKYSNQLQARVRWLKVLRAAQETKGGSWQPNFSADYMTSSRLQKLADVIDEAFLNGSFAEVCGPSYVVQDSRLTPEEAGACDRKACRHAAAGFEPATNSVIFYRPTWRQSPSLHRPLQADGVYCTDKLSWLAHTLGHEMVHAIVHHACPEARKHPAYQDDNGHGPIFLQLNKHIFGHDTARYKAGWGRLRPQLKVQPLQAIPALQQQESEQQEGWQSDGGSSPGWPSQQQQQQQQQWGEGQLQGPDQQLLSVADLLAGPPTLLQQQQRVERSSSGSCEQKLQSHSWQQHRASLQQQQQAHAGDASSSDASSTGSRESGDSSSSSSQTGISPYSSSKLAAIRSHMLQQRQQQELLHQQEYAALGSVGVDGLCGASGAARMRPRAWWSW